MTQRFTKIFFPEASLVFYATLGFALLLPCLSLTASPLLPEDIIIVCNDNYPGSREIAEYYAKKRQVPVDNIVCLDLPTTETIPRPVFEQRLVQPLKKHIQSQQQKGKKPVLLTIYGVPLKVGAPLATQSTSKTEERTIRQEDLKGLVKSLSEQLATITDYQLPSEKEKLQKKFTTKQLLHSIRPIIQNTMNMLSQPQEITAQSDVLREIQSLLYRLTGMAPFVRQTATNKDDSLYKIHSVLTSQLTPFSFHGIVPEKELEVAALTRSVNGLLGELVFWEERLNINKKPMASGAVDSELTMLDVTDYQLNGWLPNPFHGQFDRLAGIAAIREKTVMTARLDGPSVKDVRRMVDDALWAEEHGLTGTFYIDARGIGDTKKDFYGVYDKHLQRLRDFLKKNTTLPVVFDNKQELFKPGSCPEAALYCGWYSLGKYVDAFTWKKGAVGFHVASSEATTLRRAGSEVWTKRMIEDGITATLGPVKEPYLQSFPLPDVFFPLLLSGQMPLIEVYYRSTPYVSWRQVLIGDPLYTPFKNYPALRPNPELLQDKSAD